MDSKEIIISLLRTQLATVKEERNVYFDSLTQCQASATKELEKYRKSINEANLAVTAIREMAEARGERVQKLRKALVAVVNNAGGYAHPDASDNFLLLAPDQVAGAIKSLTGNK